MEAGTEFGTLYRRKVIIIARNLYGLQSIRAAWCGKLAKAFHSMWVFLYIVGSICMVETVCEALRRGVLQINDCICCKHSSFYT